MRKIPLNTAILAGALVVFLALPSAASAGQVVPPGNSAATQYTQVFPTSGGNVAIGKSIGEPGGGGERTPDKVIGKKTTKELEAQGPEGAAVAELATESAPTPTPEPESSQGSSGGSAGSEDGGGAGKPAADGGKPASAGGGANGHGGKQQGAPQAPAQQAQPATSAAAEAAGSGSSGVSSVLGQATGASTGQMGAFLPVILLVALVAALVYAWRRRLHEQRAAS